TPYFGGSEETAEGWLMRRLDRREIAWWFEQFRIECDPVSEDLDPPFFVQTPWDAVRYFWRQQSESTITVDQQTNDAVRTGPAIMVYPDFGPEPLFDRRYRIELHAVMVEICEEHIVTALRAAGRMPENNETGDKAPDDDEDDEEHYGRTAGPIIEVI